jgi:hypothetical protein
VNHKDADLSWPFADWRTATAYTFNFVPYGRGHQLTLYSPADGWNENIHSRHELDRSAAVEVAATIAKMKGTAVTSSCPFPRHGVAFFGNDPSVPVGAVSVDFTCEDIFVWPDYEMSREERHAWDDEAGDFVRGTTIDQALDYFGDLFRTLGEPVWNDQRSAERYFEAQSSPAPTIDCNPPPRTGSPCRSGLCAVPGDPHSYLQCTDGRWLRFTEHPRATP